MRSGSTISALVAKELNALKGERCSRLLAETGGQRSTRSALEISGEKLACRNESDRSQKEGAHDS